MRTATRLTAGLRAIGMLLPLAFGAFPIAAAGSEERAWLFTYFVKNGEDGLHLAWSDDGYRWQALNEGRSFLAPEIGRKEKLMRDPCVARGPDGTYHMVWTSGWNEQGIGYASTKDFMTWSAQREIPVMGHEPDARNCWAPEVVYDAERGEFVIFWATTIPGRFPATEGSSETKYNHRMYFTTTRDFETFAPTRIFYEPGFSVIDASFLQADGRLHLIIKDETVNPPRKYLQIAAAESFTGPFGNPSDPFTPSGLWVEGPTAVKVGGDYLVYFDAYKDRKYGAMRSRDLRTWEDVSARMEFPFDGTPERMRHGTVIEVPRALVDRLRGSAGNPQPAAPSAPAPDLASNPAAARGPIDPSLPTIFIAGDSTAARNNGNPTQGWAFPFSDYVDPTKANVANRARGGRSSRTFVTEGLWDDLLADAKPGDFILIQFGHNDASPVNEDETVPREKIRSRGSLPGLGDESREIVNSLTNQPETVRTYGWYVRKMIRDAKARGVTPVLVSLTLRNIWRDGKVERGSGRYRQWMRGLARAENVAFVDLSRVLADQYQTMGPDAVRALFGNDHTHTNSAGADFNAAAVVAGLKGIRDGPFGNFLSAKGAAVEPDRIGWLNLSEPANPQLPTLLLIGDSTVRNGRGDGSNGEWGWGDPLAGHIDPAKINIVNRAVGGLSSRTFRTQGHWERALMLLKPGDVVAMQFGHNDSGPLNDTSRARGTIKGAGDETEVIDNLLTGKRETVHTYGWYLRQYIREARAAGATPIVCSPVPRKIWRDGRIVRAGESYAGWARLVADEEGAAFIDLNELVAQRYDKLGLAEVDALFADEHTHTNRAGAELSANVVAGELARIEGATFSGALRSDGRR